MSKWLQKGTLRCPREQQSLEWETFHGMRIVKEQEGVRLYQARCPKCKYYWGVRA